MLGVDASECPCCVLTHKIAIAVECADESGDCDRVADVAERNAHIAL